MQQLDYAVVSVWLVLLNLLLAYAVNNMSDINGSTMAVWPGLTLAVPEPCWQAVQTPTAFLHHSGIQSAGVSILSNKEIERASLPSSHVWEIADSSLIIVPELSCPTSSQAATFVKSYRSQLF